MKLYTYWRSSAAYRVRIALELKGITYESVAVHLVRDGGEHLSAAFRAINPSAAVPALEIDGGAVLTQSLAIIEYLDELYPSPPLLPREPLLRARTRAAAQAIACDVHPINNLRVAQYLKGTLGHSQDDVVGWMRHWMRVGFDAYARIIDQTGPFSFGDGPTIADLCLVPQLYNARRWGVELGGLERLLMIEEACGIMDGFRRALPEQQPDSERTQGQS
jgi:maleylacetoacetate isomerase/maleylpyruvate isomerase